MSGASVSAVSDRSSCRSSTNDTRFFGHRPTRFPELFFQKHFTSTIFPSQMEESSEKKQPAMTTTGWVFNKIFIPELQDLTSDMVTPPVW